MQQAGSKSSSIQEHKQAVQIDPFPRQFEDDTIDFYAIWTTLWKNKVLIILLTIVAASCSILYALQKEPIFKAETLLLKPKAKNIQSLNVLGILNSLDFEKTSGLIQISDKITSDDVFTRFKQNLKSRTVHKKFIKEQGLMEVLNPSRNTQTSDLEIFRGFAALINIDEVNEITSFSIELNDAEVASQLVNKLTEFVDKETIHQFVQDKENEIENQIIEIEYNIRSKRLMAEKRREDQIIRYTENAQIAKELGMIERVDATSMIQTTQMNVDIATATTPLYYLGYEALMTEINVLRNRKSDDPFISGLRDLQEQLAMLRTIKFNKERMRSVHVDQAAYTPKNPISPNRRLIVSFGTLIGLFSGLFLAFFIEFVRVQREKHSG